MEIISFVFHSLHKYIFNKTHWQSICVVYYYVSFSATYLGSSEPPCWRTTYKRKHVRQHNCVFLLECVNCTCIWLQQFYIYTHYQYCLKLDGFKCWQVCSSYYNSCKYKNCSTVFICAYVQIFWNVHYVHTKLVCHTGIIYIQLCFHAYFLMYLVPPDDSSDKLIETQKIICINKVHRLTLKVLIRDLTYSKNGTVML